MFELVEPLQPREIGEHPIEQNQVDAVLFKQFAGFAGAAGAQYVVARRFAGKSDQLPNGGFVFDDEDGFGHGLYLSVNIFHARARARRRKMHESAELRSNHAWKKRENVSKDSEKNRTFFEKTQKRCIRLILWTLSLSK